MYNYLKILTVILTFCIIMWIQNVDDKKYKKQRTTYFDTYNIPVLVSSIVGLLLTLDNNVIDKCKRMIYSIFNQLDDIKQQSVNKENINLSDTINPIKIILTEIENKPLNLLKKATINNIPVNLKLPTF